MKKTLQVSANTITTISKWFWIASQWIAFILMVIVFVDVFFRRLKITFVGSKDLIEVAFLALFFLSFSYAWVRGDHIHIDILIERTPAKFKRFSRLLTATIGIFFIGCLAYASFSLLTASFQFGSVTPDLKFPQWIMQLVMLLGSIAFTLQIIVSVFFELGIVKKPSPYEE